MGITIILYQTEHPENIGSIARAATNFDFHDIVLVDPKCSVNERSRRLAKHGKRTLESIRTADEGILGSFDILVATQGRASTGYNLVRAPITPRQLAERINGSPKTGVGIVFGPEGEGLPKDILRRADVVLAIPTSRDYPSMNLAQAVTVVLYELSMMRGEENKITLPYRPMGREEHAALLKLIDDTLDTMHFRTESQRETQRLMWRRMVGRSFMTRRECAALMGFLKGVKHRR